MKKWIVLLILLIILLIGNLNAQVFHVDGSCQERQCEICGKIVVEFVRGSTTYGNWGVFNSEGWICSGLMLNSLSFSQSHNLCQDCYSKYADFYQKLMIQTDKDWLESAIKENLDKRKVNRDINKSQVLKKLLDQAKEIERKIRELDKTSE